MTILSKQSAEDYKKQNYTERMSRTGRPVSPHVTIYALPIAAISSITNRVTGITLTFGAVGVGALEILGGNGTALSVVQEISGLGLGIVTAAKFSVTFPIVYHYFGGMRHLAWDHFPQLLNNIDVAKASYVLIVSSVVTSVGLSLL